MPLVLNNFNKYILSIRIIHFALILGLILFWAVSTFGKILPFQGTNESLKVTFQVLVPLAIIACITASQMLYNAKLYAIQKEMELEEKLVHFRMAFIIKCALLEIPAILSLVALLLTAEQLFSLLAAGMIAYLISQFPNKQKILDALPLSHSEIETLTK